MREIIANGAFMGCETEARGNETTLLAVAPELSLGCTL